MARFCSPHNIFVVKLDSISINNNFCITIIKATTKRDKNNNKAITARHDSVLCPFGFVLIEKREGKRILFGINVSNSSNDIGQT